jgi:hypothetical protein
MVSDLKLDIRFIEVWGECRIRSWQNLVEKVNAKKIDVINTVKCVGLNVDVNPRGKSRHVQHGRPLFLRPWRLKDRPYFRKTTYTLQTY